MPISSPLFLLHRCATFLFVRKPSLIRFVSRARLLHPRVAAQCIWRLASSKQHRLSVRGVAAMPPKKAAARTRRRRASLSRVLPMPLSSTSSSNSTQPSTPRSPSALSHTRAPSSVSPATLVHSDATATTNAAKGTKTTKAAAPCTPSSSWGVGAVVLVIVGVLLAVSLLCLPAGFDAAPRHHPCACATAAAASNPLAKAVLSRRSGVSGVHWQRAAGASDRTDFDLGCTDAVVATLSGPFVTVADLRGALQRPFEQQLGRSCVVWVTSPEAVHGVANALKELLENNALGGTPVVPPHKRGTLVLQSPLTREELKNKLPHRVVHMFTTVDPRSA